MIATRTFAAGPAAIVATFLGVVELQYARA